MKPAQWRDGNTAIIYDADYLDAPKPELFEPGYWTGRGRKIGEAGGRGTTIFVGSDRGDEWAVRHYYRGSWVANLSQDNYLWSSLSRTRAWREWRLTAELFSRGLPVPQPVAARVVRRGLRYKADLITRRITPAQSLEALLFRNALPREHWRRLGAVLRRFHEERVFHGDITQRNILVTPQFEFALVDFDRARLRKPGSWRAANLDRLLRAIRKGIAQGEPLHFSMDDWEALRDGYSSSAPG